MRAKWTHYAGLSTRTDRRKNARSDGWTHSRCETQMGNRSLTAALGCALALLTAPASAQPLERVQRAVDGDTLVLSTGETIRLQGIDAPEIHPCRCARECDLGTQAQRWLHRLTVNGVALTRTGLDRYRRTLAYAYTADGADIGHELIARGLARQWTGRREPWCQ